MKFQEVYRMVHTSSCGKIRAIEGVWPMKSRYSDYNFSLEVAWHTEPEFVRQMAEQSKHEVVDTFKMRTEEVSDHLAAVSGLIRDHMEEVANELDILEALFEEYKSRSGISEEDAHYKETKKRLKKYRKIVTDYRE